MIYDLYFFVEDCLFPQREQVMGEYVISSGGYLLAESYQVYLTRFILQTPDVPKSIPTPDREFIHNYGVHHPVTIISRKSIEADNEQDAAETVIQDAFDICDLLSLERQCSAEYFAHIIVNKEQGTSLISIKNKPYIGNLAPSFTPISETLLDYSNAVDKDPAFKLQIYLYKEAMAEENNDFKYFRHWNLLEVMAISEHGERGSAESKVTKMIREIYEEKNFDMQINERNLLEEIPVWLRHRDCVAHYGVCQRDNDEICRRDLQRYKICREAIEKAYIDNNDWCLWDLKNTSGDILKHRIYRAIQRGQ
jgi:hypothetical protein